ncbi:hypothetical protein GQ457_09G016550 [Hibiscus cannabinus]
MKIQGKSKKEIPKDVVVDLSLLSFPGCSKTLAWSSTMVGYGECCSISATREILPHAGTAGSKVHWTAIRVSAHHNHHPRLSMSMEHTSHPRAGRQSHPVTTFIHSYATALFIQKINPSSLSTAECPSTVLCFMHLFKVFFVFLRDTTSFLERALLDGEFGFGVSSSVVLDPSSSASDAMFSSTAKSAVLTFQLAFLLIRGRGMVGSIGGAGGRVASGAGARGDARTGAFPLSFLVRVLLLAVAVLAGGLGTNAAVSTSGVAGSVRSSGAGAVSTSGVVGSVRSSGAGGLTGGVAVELGPVELFSGRADQHEIVHSGRLEIRTRNLRGVDALPPSNEKVILVLHYSLLVAQCRDQSGEK